MRFEEEMTQQPQQEQATSQKQPQPSPETKEDRAIETAMQLGQ